MLLTKLKEYVKTHRLVSLFELTTSFNVDPEILRDMLRLLIRKGKVRQQNKTNQCGSKCVKCHPFVTEMYEWVS